MVRRPNAGVAIDDTYLISPSTVLDTRIGVAYGSEQQEPFSANFDLASLGFPQSFVKSVQEQNFPTIWRERIRVFGRSRLEEAARVQLLAAIEPLHAPRQAHAQDGRAIESVSGKFLQRRESLGSFSFGPAQTGGPTANAPAAGTGLATASLLLGYASGGSIDTAVAVSIANMQYGVFFQDDYRVTPKLTLNLGVRWEYQTPVTERYDRTTRGFAYNTPSPLQVSGLKLNGGLLLCAASTACPAASTIRTGRTGLRASVSPTR